MSNKQKWTPGPWRRVSGRFLCQINIGTDRDTIATVYGDTGENEANTNLIAASPTMADVLEVAPDPNDMDFTNPERFKRIYSEWYTKRCAALAKARGEQL